MTIPRAGVARGRRQGRAAPRARRRRAAAAGRGDRRGRVLDPELQGRHDPAGASGGWCGNIRMCPGIDFAGTVERSDSPEFKPGDPVVLTGWRVGEAQWGGYAERARVKASLFRAPAGGAERAASDGDRHCRVYGDARGHRAGAARVAARRRRRAGDRRGRRRRQRRRGAAVALGYRVVGLDRPAASCATI